jgi:hypothetical protein
MALTIFTVTLTIVSIRITATVGRIRSVETGPSITSVEMKCVTGVETADIEVEEATGNDEDVRLRREIFSIDEAGHPSG